MTEEIKEKMLNEVFNILIENELDTKCIYEYARKSKLPPSYIMYLFNKWIHSSEMPCPTEEQKLKYNSLVVKKHEREKALKAKDMFDRYLKSACSKEELENIASTFNSSIKVVKNLITKYVNGEFAYAGAKPTNEEVLRYNSYYEKNFQDERNSQMIKKAINAKYVFDTYLSSNLDKNVLDQLSIKYNTTKPTILSWIRDYVNDTYKDYGYAPVDTEKEKYTLLTKEERQKNQDIITDAFRKERAVLAKKAFDAYLNSGLSLDVLPLIASNLNVSIGIIKTEIRKYRSGEYFSYGYYPSKEELEKYELLYQNRKPRKNEVPESSKIRIGKEVYETLINNNMDNNSLIPLMKKTGLNLKELKRRLYVYRQRVIEPKPTLEQEIRYITLIRHLDSHILIELISSSEEGFIQIINREGKDNLIDYLNKIYKVNNKLINAQIDKLRIKINSYKELINETKEEKTYDEIAQIYIDAMLDYINDYNYTPQSTFKQIPYFQGFVNFHAIEDGIKFMASKDSMVSTMYPMFTRARQGKIIRFNILLKEINNKIKIKESTNKKYDIIDLCLDIDTTIDDFLTMLRYVRSLNMNNNGNITLLEKIIMKSKIAEIKSDTPKEKLDAIKYSYNGVNLTPEIKQKLISYLNNHNIRVSEYILILAFEKYVKGDLPLTNKFHI